MATVDRTGDKNPNWSGGFVQLVCLVCGNPFSVIPSRSKKARFCTLKCANVFQTANPYQGTKRPRKPRRGTAVMRFWAKTNVGSLESCWEWTGNRNKWGYGVHHDKSSKVLAHRFSWALHNSEIPEGMYVCHRCDNPGCVNPAHLFVGTQTDNMRDAKAKGRMVFPKTRPAPKISDEQVATIRQRVGNGETARSVAKNFGISEALVSHIVNFKKRFSTHIKP